MFENQMQSQMVFWYWETMDNASRQVQQFMWQNKIARTNILKSKFKENSRKLWSLKLWYRQSLAQIIETT